MSFVEYKITNRRDVERAIDSPSKNQYAYFSFSISPYFLHFLSRENRKSKYRNMAADDRERDD